MGVVDVVALQRFSGANCLRVAAMAGVGIEDARVGYVIDVRQKDFRHTARHIVERRDTRPLNMMCGEISVKSLLVGERL
jgi:hypothetical protein